MTTEKQEAITTVLPNSQHGSFSAEEEGIIIKPDSDYKLAKDGKTVLLPQPSDSSDDPLNWSWIKKHLVLLSLIPGCFLTGTVALQTFQMVIQLM